MQLICTFNASVSSLYLTLSFKYFELPSSVKKLGLFFFLTRTFLYMCPGFRFFLNSKVSYHSSVCFQSSKFCGNFSSVVSIFLSFFGTVGIRLYIYTIICIIYNIYTHIHIHTYIYKIFILQEFGEEIILVLCN